MNLGRMDLIWNRMDWMEIDWTGAVVGRTGKNWKGLSGTGKEWSGTTVG